MLSMYNQLKYTYAVNIDNMSTKNIQPIFNKLLLQSTYILHACTQTHDG